VRRPAIVVVFPVGGQAFARAVVASAEQEDRVRRELLERDVVSEIAFAVGVLLQALDELHDDEAAA
jgi:hypothetical protein